MWILEQPNFTSTKGIFTRKKQIAGFAIGAHPFRRKATGFAWADVPTFGVENGAPRAPGLRGIKNAQAAFETHIVARILRLAPQVPP